jgi:hypothetical protein
MIEIELIESKANKISKIYEINQKNKFSDNNKDYIAEVLDKDDNLHINLINVGVGLSIFSVFI